ncbi:MAG: hypothetical protein ACRDIU_11465, partial [Actinomycetota bacterium]
TYRDAWAEAVVDGQKIFVHVTRTDQVAPGIEMETAEFSGIAAKAVQVGGSFGKLWRFGCVLPDLGEHIVDIAFSNDPAHMVPRVYKLLNCS